jgi:hypothetical protein
LSDISLEPGNGIFAQLPALRELAGELEAVDRHSGKSGELHYLSDPKELHVDISCDLPLRPELTADAQGPSLVLLLREVSQSSCPVCADTSRGLVQIAPERHRNSDGFPGRVEFNQWLTGGARLFWRLQVRHDEISQSPGGPEPAIRDDRSVFHLADTRVAPTLTAETSSPASPPGSAARCAGDLGVDRSSMIRDLRHARVGLFPTNPALS